MGNPFGLESGEPNYAAIVNLIAQMQPRNVSTEKLSDVITILEYAKREIVKRHVEVQRDRTEVEKWRHNLEEREKQLAIRQRAVELFVSEKPRWFSKWR